MHEGLAVHSDMQGIAGKVAFVPQNNGMDSSSVKQHQSGKLAVCYPPVNKGKESIMNKRGRVVIDLVKTVVITSRCQLASISCIGGHIGDHRVGRGG
jgi:hypothetical protein